MRKLTLGKRAGATRAGPSAPARSRLARDEWWPLPPSAHRRTNDLSSIRKTYTTSHLSSDMTAQLCHARRDKISRHDYLALHAKVQAISGSLEHRIITLRRSDGVHLSLTTAAQWRRGASVITIMRHRPIPRERGAFAGQTRLAIGPPYAFAMERSRWGYRSDRNVAAVRRSSDRLLPHGGADPAPSDRSRTPSCHRCA